MTQGARRIRIDEDLHLVDVRSGLPVQRAVDVADAVHDATARTHTDATADTTGDTAHTNATPAAPDGPAVRTARHGALVAADHGAHSSLAALGDAIRAGRARLAEAAESLGVGIVAAGALASPGVTFRGDAAEPETAPGHEFRTRADARFRVTVEVADADEAQYVARRVVPFAPVLLALSASSPYRADGDDSGYASLRAFEARCSPAHVPAVRADSAAHVTAAEDALLETGVVADRVLIDIDARPTADGTGVVLRVCDSCSTVDTLVVVAALFRAMVSRVLTHRDDPREAPKDDLREDPKEAAWADPEPAVLAAAFWRAARSGPEGDLVDPWSGSPRPAREMLAEVVEAHGEQLADGEQQLVDDLLDGVIGAGSSSARQRAARRRRGRRRDVVAVLRAETVGRIRPRTTSDDDGMRSMLAAYSPLGEAVTEEVRDEAITTDGTPRPEYVDTLKAVADLGPETLRARTRRIDDTLRERGVTLKVYGEPEPQVFPLDPVPRIVPADQWSRISAGIEQRVRALELFLRDIYTSGEIVRAGVVPQSALDRAPGYRRVGLSVPAGALRAAVSGVDLVSTGPGEWLVLEDNLRMPGALAMAVTLRESVTRALPEFGARGEIHDPVAGLDGLRETLRAAAPEGVDDPAVAVVAAEDELGAHDLARAAAAVDAPLVTPGRLRCRDGRLWRLDPADVGTGGAVGATGGSAGTGSPGRGEEQPVDVLYVRMDEEMLLASTGADDVALREGLVEVVAAGGVALVNAPGNGVADDKAIYALVPEIIGFYLGEKPLIGQVGTYLCADPRQRAEVLDRLDELVIKPIDGFGGSGITVGPECTPRELDERWAELRRHGERFVAQEVQALSTLPTFDGHDLQRRHVDMRAFVMLRSGPEGEVVASAPPVAMTRVAPAGTMVVNASSGGGGKDTWIHRA